MIPILLACVLSQSSAPAIQWGGAHSGVERIRIQLVTDAEMLEDAWRLTHDDSIDGLPQVNFDRCRLVLACRGRETGVQRVAATGVDHSGLETVLTIDASYSRESREQATQETTAWGLFMIPLTPERVRVRRNASEDPRGEPQWETVAVLEPDDRRSREQEASRAPKPGSSPEMLIAYKEHLEANRRPFTMKLQRPPSYFVSHDYDERWVRAIRSGIDVTRDYLGNYGPVQVYIVGQENEELADPAHRNEIAEAFCSIHNAGSDRPIEDCLADDGGEMARKAVEGASEVFMTAAFDSDPRVAELVFINAHTMGGEETMPVLGIHEYVHVYQKSFEFTPTWMMEGAAVLLAGHLGAKHGWGEFEQAMEWCARHLEEVEDLEYTIRDMEEIETASPDVARWHHELAYEAGPWAVAFAISRSPSRSIGQHYRSFYPLVDKMGWKAALCEYSDMENIDAFYSGFESFMQRPLADRLAVLDALKD